MKNLFFTTLALIAISLTSLAQSPIFTINTHSSHNTEDIEEYGGYIYVLATFGQRTTFNSGLTIYTGSHDMSYYVACYEANTGNLKWVNYIYSNPTDESGDFQAVDLGISEDGEISVAFHLFNYGFPTADFQVETVDLNGNTISGPTTVTYNIGPGSQYFVTSLAQNGMIYNSAQLYIPSSVTIKAIDSKSSTAMYIGGTSTGDGHISEINYSGTVYNAVTSTVATSSSGNMVEDLKYDQSTNNIFATGYFKGNNPMNSNLIFSSAQSDAFILVFNSGLVAPVAKTKSNTPESAKSVSIDIEKSTLSGLDMDIAITGEFDKALPNWGGIGTNLPNAFIGKFTFNTSSSNLTNDWMNSLEDSFIAYAYGNDVVIHDQIIAAVGRLKGELSYISQFHCGLPANANPNDGWLFGFERYPGNCVFEGLESLPPSAIYNNDAVTAVNGVVFTAGDYSVDLSLQSATNSSMIPFSTIYNFPLNTENYVSRYSALSAQQYFKTDHTTSTNDVNSKQPKLELVPNPASDQVKIIMDKNEPFTVQIYSVTGQLVLQSTVTGNTIDVSELDAGIYLVQVTTSDRVETLSLAIN